MNEHDMRIREEFSRQAPVMAQAAFFNDAQVLARMREAACIGADTRVLDVACGPGIVVDALADGAAEIVGCDLTMAMLERAQARCTQARRRNTRWVLGRAEALPFAEGEFDVVVARSALHHFAEPIKTIAEMARVLKRGGRLVNVDVTASEQPDEAALHNALEILRDPSHVRMLPRSELHRYLAQSGLEVQSCVQWINRREFDEWLRITNAPERAAPLRTVMAALAGAGVSAGIGLNLVEGCLRFEHHAALTVAVKAG